VHGNGPGALPARLLHSVHVMAVLSHTALSHLAFHCPTLPCRCPARRTGAATCCAPSQLSFGRGAPAGCMTGCATFGKPQTMPAPGGWSGWRPEPDQYRHPQPLMFAG
jgi:hypothetical protein